MITRYPFPRKRICTVLFSGYLFLLMYLTRDSQAGMYLLGFYRAQFLSIGATAVCALAFLFYNRKQLRSILTDGRIPLAILFSLSILIPMVLKKDWQMMYFSMVYCILVAVLISYFADPEKTARIYVLLMCFLAGYSLLCTYLLRLTADRGILVPSTFANSFDAVFYNYIFSFVSKTFARSRNFGIFREPGVYQFFLFLALYLNNYQVRWEQDAIAWWINGLLTLTMLSTFSTAGVAITVVFLLMLYFDKAVFRTKPGRVMTAAFLSLLLVFGAYLLLVKPPLYTQLMLMVEKIFVANPSLNDRIDCVLFNLYVIQWRPFVGRTLDYILLTVTHNTSSSTILIGVLGVFFGLLNLFGWITLVLRGKGSIPMKLTCIAALLAAINNENLITNPYLWLFPILSLIEALLPLMHRRKAT